MLFFLLDAVCSPPVSPIKVKLGYWFVSLLVVWSGLDGWFSQECSRPQLAQPHLLSLCPQELDMSDFEEQFKTKSQGPSLDLSALKSKAAQKTPSKATLIEANRAKNLAITLRKGNLGADRICQAIET